MYMHVYEMKVIDASILSFLIIARKRKKPKIICHNVNEGGKS